MRKLLRFLKDYKKESILSPLFKLLEASFELFVPLVMAAIIDTGIGNKDGGFILKMCGILILLALVGLTCSITAQYFAAKAAVGFATKVRHALFDHIQKLSYTEMDTAGTDTMITRMTSDINQAQSGVNMVLRLFLRSPFIVFGAMIMAFTFAASVPAFAVSMCGHWCRSTRSLCRPSTTAPALPVCLGEPAAFPKGCVQRCSAPAVPCPAACAHRSLQCREPPAGRPDCPAAAFSAAKKSQGDVPPPAAPVPPPPVPQWLRKYPAW